MMTERNYKMIAEAIAGCSSIPDSVWIAKSDLVNRLSNAFMMDNPDFDSGKFYVACYPEAETEPE